MTSSFDNLMIRTKWNVQVRNVRVGDVVLIRSTGRLTPGEYKRGLVLEVMEDKDGLVRNAIVQLYRHDARRKVDCYNGEGQAKVKMAIQRLVVLLPVEEQVMQHVEDDTRVQARGGHEFSVAEIEEIVV